MPQPLNISACTRPRATARARSEEAIPLDSTCPVLEATRHQRGTIERQLVRAQEARVTMKQAEPLTIGAPAENIAARVAHQEHLRSGEHDGFGGWCAREAGCAVSDRLRLRCCSSVRSPERVSLELMCPVGSKLAARHVPNRR